MPYITLENGKKIKISRESYDNLARAIPNKRWRAEMSDGYYYIDEDANILWEGDWRWRTSDRKYELGNYFKTGRDARRVRDKIQALAHINDWARENTPFTPNWSDITELKYVVRISNSAGRRELGVGYNYASEYQPFLPVFETREDAERCIKECEGDLRIVFGLNERD